jgi:hypothetical protein
MFGYDIGLYGLETERTASPDNRVPKPGIAKDSSPHVHANCRTDIATNSKGREPRLTIRDETLLLHPRIVLKGQYS